MGEDEQYISDKVKKKLSRLAKKYGLVLKISSNRLDEHTIIMDRASKRYGNHTFIRFTLSKPWGNDIMISHDLHIDKTLRNKGIGQKLLKVKEEIARDCVTLWMICQVMRDNSAEKHILKKNGWKQIDILQPQQTYHILYIKALTY